MKERVFAFFADAWDHHRAPFVGTCLGLLFAVLVLVIGFFPTVFLVLCGGFGFFLGRRLERDDVLEELSARLPERIQYHHWF